MRFFNYETALTPDGILDRFEHFRATETHTPLNPFSSYYDPRIGLRVYIKGNHVKGYYEDGSTTRRGSLQSNKVWFEMDIKPTEAGSHIGGVIYSSPYLNLILVFLTLEGVYQAFHDPVGAGFLFFLSMILLLFENRNQASVKSQLLQLVPSAKTKRKSQNNARR